LENSSELTKVVALGGLLLANIGAIMGAFISIKVSLAKLETQSQNHTKDIDNLAEIIGTQRSRSRSRASGVD